MLKLKRLQILGFKSFCDRTELKFHGDGVAAIIGPNGCGKSNISDAISWVLGEQSAKTLRGARMEDVIFAGTRDRKPTGMAEVSLTLIDPEAYDGPDANAPTEIDIQDDLPKTPPKPTSPTTGTKPPSAPAPPKPPKTPSKTRSPARPKKSKSRARKSTHSPSPSPTTNRSSRCPRTTSPRPRTPHRSEPSPRTSFLRFAAASSTSSNSATEKSSSRAACSAPATANIC